MFSLHETTRIWWCRGAFVALCLVPTCVVAAWCVAVRLPSYRAAHERAIEARLGWRAQLERASAPQPGLTLYEGLELSDADSGQLLARVPFAEVDARGQRATITLSYPATISGLRLDALLKSAERLLRAEDDVRSVALVAHNVTLHLVDGDQTLSDVTATLEPGESKIETKIVVRFGLAAAGAPPAVKEAHPTAELSIVRPRNPAAGATASFTTGGAPLPCNLLASSWPAIRKLGKASTFDGQIEAARKSGRWKVEVSGRLAQIDLMRLLGTFPHELTGTAEVQLDRFTVDHDRLEAAAGKLSAGPGTISRSLVHAAHENLQLEVARQAFIGRDNRLDYRKLGLAFEIDETGLAIVGDVPDAAGAVLVDEQSTLLAQPPEGRQPVVNLLRALVPQTVVQVPATRETNPLAAFLPVPPLVPPPGSETPLPNARAIRVGPH